MAIFIQHGRIVKGVTGKHYVTQMKLVTRFENDYYFGFDITNPDNWKKFLRKYRTPEGKLLPRKTKEGDPIAYYVFMVGVPKFFREVFPGADKYTSYYCFFPGEKLRRDKTKSGFLVPKFGRIDD